MPVFRSRTFLTRHTPCSASGLRRHNQSLQEYLREPLIEEASRPTLDEVLDRAGGRSGGKMPLKAAVAAIRDDRARRCCQRSRRRAGRRRHRWRCSASAAARRAPRCSRTDRSRGRFGAAETTGAGQVMTAAQPWLCRTFLRCRCNALVTSTCSAVAGSCARIELPRRGLCRAWGGAWHHAAYRRPPAPPEPPDLPATSKRSTPPE